MVYLIFVVSSGLLVLAALKLAEYADVIALRTGLGRIFIGTLLLAGGTSLPEFLTAISSINQAVPNLAAGNMFGSNMFNIALIGIIDLVYWRVNVLRHVTGRHVLTAGFCVLLSSLAVFFVQASLPYRIGWVGLDSLCLITVYIASVYLLHLNSALPSSNEEELGAEVPPLWRGILGFALASLLLVIVTPHMVASSAEIARITGLGSGFIGTTLVSIITSLPELATCTAAVRFQAYDLAIGNLLGSVMFNMFSLGVTDFFYGKGLFLTAIDPIFGLVGILSLILIGLALLSNAISRRHARFQHIDSVFMICVYLLGILFVYQNGLIP